MRQRPSGTMLLSMVGPGECVRLLEVRGNTQRSRRLAELGLTPGVEVRMVQNASDPLLLAVRDTRLALGRNLAHTVLVEPL
ncbi:MAG: ferrous iron transport protein A [Chloroflexi bacterium AL-W]|nr:ferrous iron transport protein A [Chloroflexi bacterium AL-N1]NOK65933.1 ferrous iron transport protein A [Chloroflexi bacterium AL-N10]NOK72814.1 ferrous iron transport protein A [Chloroflexi bacterium AL-N5]NOK79711.1 ferrous iron transport protein A [Chloroflexi bacterium AL-W]NOK93036.1 ferrous iron transport protein A [Chloroflexi bacterium AL-N15]